MKRGTLQSGIKSADMSDDELYFMLFGGIESL